MDALEIARCLLAVWFVFLGAAIGSFLNVVIYRVPAGLSIAWPGSHCPMCKHAIRWYDNLPILGWLMLRGRCRDCQAAISIRYPLVEALTAGMFFLLAWSEFLRHKSSGLVLGPSDVRGPYVMRFGECLWHCGLMATLLVAAAIAFDGKPAPLKIFLPILLAGILLPLFWPDLRPFPAWPSLMGNALRGLVDGGSALFPDLALGYAIYLIFGRKRLAFGPFLYGTLCVGAVLGWQAVAIVAPISLIIDRLLALAAGAPWAKRGSAVAVLLLATLGWIVGWALYSGAM
jgi:leader peptidase (prepilin peptidase)/N-methyltransferase